MKFVKARVAKFEFEAFFELDIEVRIQSQRLASNPQTMYSVLHSLMDWAFDDLLIHPSHVAFIIYRFLCLDSEWHDSGH